MLVQTYATRWQQCTKDDLHVCLVWRPDLPYLDSEIYGVGQEDNNSHPWQWFPMWTYNLASTWHLKLDAKLRGCEHLGSSWNWDLFNSSQLHFRCQMWMSMLGTSELGLYGEPISNPYTCSILSILFLWTYFEHQNVFDEN